MSKHTPGPWVAMQISDEYNPLEVKFGVIAERQPIASKCNDICAVWSRGGNKKTAANARLIAAAPELLNALKAMVEGCSNAPMPAESFDMIPIAAARLAIAKAEAA